MQIQNNNYQPNFTSIYRMKHANASTYKKLLKEVLPGAMLVKNQEYTAFIGANPHEIHSVGLINSLRDKKYSDSWFRQNSAQYGIRIPNLDDSDIWVFSGKDANIPIMYKNEVMEKEQPKGFFKKIVSYIKGYRDFSKHQDEIFDVPEHLRSIKYATILNDQYTEGFHTLLAGKDISEAKSIEDLATKIILSKD